MHVVIDMIDAEAVVAVASGTIPKLEIRVIGVRSAADGAFVPVRARGVVHAHLFGRFSEINGLFCISGLIWAQHTHQVLAAEKEKVQHGDNREKRRNKGAYHHVGYDRNDKKCGVNQGEPFDFHRDDEKQENTLLRK